MRHTVALLAGGILVFSAAGTASALPNFAQRYGVDCHMCHSGFPGLNKTGHRFKERGFRLESEDAFDVKEWMKSVPVRARVSGSSYFFEDEDESVEFAFIKVLSAGSLGSRVSYWVDDGFLIDDVDGNDTHTEPDNAWARVELLPGGRLYARGGRIEMDLPFTQTRTPNLFPYDIYFANTGLESDHFASYRHGVEFGGSFKEDTIHWSAAVVDGTPDGAVFEALGIEEETDLNVFLRAARRGDTNRIGAFAYIGQNTLASRDTSGRPMTWSDDLVRVGADVDLWFSKLNVYGLYMYGSNSDSLPSASGGGSGESATFHGGFLQADLHAFEKPIPGFLKEIALTFTLRGNYARLPTEALDASEDVTSIFPGARLHLRERFRVVAEYGFQGQGRKNFGGVQAEIVF